MSKIKPVGDESKARQLAQAVGKVAGALCGAAVPCLRPKSGESCVLQEEQRKLTFAERRKGWARRPFYAYDHGQLCDACAAYWHASMCQICLLDVAKREAL
jgi:hypothetical protein